MTTILASGVPWHSVLPMAGMAVISDTRTSYVNPVSKSQLAAPPFGATMKARPLGRFAIGSGAGDQVIVRRVLAKFESYFTRNPKVGKEQAVVSRLTSLYRKAVAEVRWERTGRKRSQKPPTRDAAQVLVTFVDSAGFSKVWIFNDNGADGATLGDGRGPYLFGSGIYRVTGESSEVDVSDLWKRIRTHYERKRAPMSYAASQVLYVETHILAKAFYETYIEARPDQFTGDGIEILTLSPDLGVEEFELWPYHLGPGQTPGEGEWEQATPPFLAEARPGRSPVRVRTINGRTIASLHLDEDENLSVLARVTPKMGTLSGAIRRSQVPPEVIEAAERAFGRRPGDFFHLTY